jgi:hypothetical protein
MIKYSRQKSSKASEQQKKITEIERKVDEISNGKKGE